MCMAPEVPEPPAQRQAMKQPERKVDNTDDPNKRRRGYASLVARSPSLQSAPTTTTMGG